MLFLSAFFSRLSSVFAVIFSLYCSFLFNPSFSSTGVQCVKYSCAFYVYLLLLFAYFHLSTSFCPLVRACLNYSHFSGLLFSLRAYSLLPSRIFYVRYLSVPSTRMHPCFRLLSAVHASSILCMCLLVGSLFPLFLIHPHQLSTPHATYLYQPNVDCK